MAINIQPVEGDGLRLDMSNGHLEALKKIVADYNLKGEREALYFMLAVFSLANGQPIEVNGGKYVPTAEQRKMP